MVPLARHSVALALMFLATWSSPSPGQTPASTSQTPAYVMITTSARHVHDEITFEYSCPRFKAREWILYASRLSELPWQTEVRSALLPGGRPAKELSPSGRPVLFARIPVQGAIGREGLTFRVEYEANLRKRRLMKRGPGMADAPLVAPLSPQDRKLWTSNGHQFDFKTASFQAWLLEKHLKRGLNEDEVDFGRRVFLAIKDSFDHVVGEKLDRLASHVTEARKSDNCGLSIVFTSAMRANGVPSRIASGRWARPSERGNAADEAHVRAEFFATGVGWIPVDLFMAMVVDKSEEGLEFFGTDNADFLTLHHDTDLDFDFIAIRKTMETCQGPLYWVTGSGSLDDFRVVVNSKIESEPLDLSEPFPKPGVRRPDLPSTTTVEEPGRAQQPQTQTTLFGIMTDRRDEFIMVKGDGDDKPVKYTFDKDVDKKVATDLKAIFTVARVQLVYQGQDDSRRLIRIKKAQTKASGTVTGEVVEAHDWWVEVKPKNGPPDGYAANFPEAKWKATSEVIKGLKPGDIVTIHYTTDSERHRIDTIKRQEKSSK